MLLFRVDNRSGGEWFWELKCGLNAGLRHSGVEFLDSVEEL